MLTMETRILAVLSPAADEAAQFRKLKWVSAVSRC
jgi:hypothetical protein